MEINCLEERRDCKDFKCSDDCKCPHKSKSEEQLEIILNEMLGMSGMLQKEPQDPNNIEPAINDKVDKAFVTDNSDSPNSLWVPIINKDTPRKRQSLGDTFNEGILAFNKYVRDERRKRMPESSSPGALYPCRLQFENIQDNLKQDREKEMRMEKQRDFDEGVRRMVYEIQKLEANKPVVESPLPPPVYPCRFEREGKLWDEMKEREIQRKYEEQKEFDKRLADVNLEIEMKMKRLKNNIITPQNLLIPPARISVGTVSSRQIREASEAKTREMFNNENMRKYNSCWSKPFKPIALQTPPNRPPQREIDTRGIAPSVKCSPLYKNLYIEMAAYENENNLENLQRDKLKNYFRSAYGMHR